MQKLQYPKKILMYLGSPPHEDWRSLDSPEGVKNVSVHTMVIIYHNNRRLSVVKHEKDHY